MSKTITINTEVNMKGVEDALTALFYDPVTRMEIHNTFAKMCDPYVPYLNGPLSQSAFANITPDHIQYTVPYAHRQYYGVGFNHTIETHPLATAKWDEAMMRDHGDEFNQAVKDILIRRYKELYG